MTLDLSAKHRVLARYQFLFRTSIAMIGAGAFLAALGVLAAVFASDMTVLGAGVLLAAVAGINAYKIAVSTMKIIEVDAHQSGWRSLQH